MIFWRNRSGEEGLEDVGEKVSHGV